MDFEKIKSEVRMQYSRSSGSGGQHVNKVASKVALRWDILASQELTDEQKQLCLERLPSHLVQGNELYLTCQKSRSQYRNRTLAFEKLRHLLQQALIPKKKRVSTKQSAASKRKRLAQKRQHAQKKQLRKKVNVSNIDLFFVVFP